jgi:hypothetical protein
MAHGGFGQASAATDPPEQFMKLGALHIIVISNLNAVAGMDHDVVEAVGV